MDNAFFRAQELKLKTAQTIVTVDLVIVRKLAGVAPELLLVQRGREPYQDMWALPGGKLADEDATLEEAALRELREETGLILPRSRWLRQMYTYGDRGRDPRPGRWISVVFYSPILNSLFWQEVKGRSLCPGGDAIAVTWYGVSVLPKLAFDHKDIVKQALAQDALDVEYRFR